MYKDILQPTKICFDLKMARYLFIWCFIHMYKLINITSFTG